MASGAPNGDPELLKRVQELSFRTYSSTYVEFRVHVIDLMV